METKLKRTPVFWVEDWPVRSFFLESYIQVHEAKTSQEKMDLLWGLIYKVLIARDAFTKKISVDKKNFEEKLSNLLKEDYIHVALENEAIDQEDVEFFLTIEGLYDNFLAVLKEAIKKDILENPERIAKIYNQQENLDLKDVYEIIEVFCQKELSLENNPMYTEEQLIHKGCKFQELGFYTEEEIKKTFLHDEVPIIGKSEGTILPIDLDNSEKRYYWIKKRHETYKRNYDQVKDDFNHFVFEYLLKENLEEIYEDLMDKYTIKYNEEYLNKLLKE